MSDTKKRKIKNRVWRWFRKVRDRVWDVVEEPAEDMLETIEDELVGLLTTAVVVGAFANIEDALEWVKGKVDDLSKPE